MAESGEIDLTTIGSAFEGLSGQLGSKLAELLSRSVDWKTVAPETVDDAAVRALIPGRAMAFGLKGADETGALVLIFEAELGVAVGMIAGGAETETVSTRLEAEADWSDDEKTAVEGPCGALADILLGAAGSGLEKRPLDFLVDSSWSAGDDPIPDGDLVVARMSVTVEEVGERSAWLIASPSVAAGLKVVSAAASGGGGAGSGELLFFGRNGEFNEKVIGQLSGVAQSATELPDFVRSFCEGDADAAVVAISRGDEALLATLSGLRDLPDCGEKGIVVVLEEPTVPNVVRCGRLGLFAVLGPEFSAEELRERLADPR